IDLPRCGTIYYYTIPSFSFSSLRLTHFLFSFNDPPTTEIYTLSLHDALPISAFRVRLLPSRRPHAPWAGQGNAGVQNSLPNLGRSEEHTSELQSRENLVCRLLLEKKKKKKNNINNIQKKNAEDDKFN